MSNISKEKPFYPLNDVKEKIRKGEFQIHRIAILSAYTDFGFTPQDIIDCVLKLNDRYYPRNENKNHFYKKDQNIKVQSCMMDVYKAKKIKDGNDVYIHLYVNNQSFVIINSFKQL